MDSMNEQSPENQGREDDFLSQDSADAENDLLQDDQNYQVDNGMEQTKEEYYAEV